MDRICIYPKDVQLITGKSERHARAVIKQLKAKHGKTKEQATTLKEVCDHYGVSEEEVRKILR